MTHKYKIGTRISFPIGSPSGKIERIVYGNIIGRRIGKFRGRKIIEYKIKFDDGSSGYYHQPEFRKVRK